MLNACNRVDACPEEYNRRAAGFCFVFFPALVISGCVTMFMYGHGRVFACLHTCKCTGWSRPPMIFHISIQAESK